MRMMLSVTFPTAKFNELSRAGQLGATLKQILEDIKPEAAYFGKENKGQRGAIIIVDVASPTDISRVTEPWYLALDAQVETSVCMLPAEVAQIDMAGLAEKYG